MDAIWLLEKELKVLDESGSCVGVGIIAIAILILVALGIIF
jgi:hypothetical protein